MAHLQIHQFSCLQDNYGFLVHDPDANLTAVIDTPDVPAIERALTGQGWTLDFILNTHHHADHAGGNLELKAKTGCRVVGCGADAERLPGIDIRLAGGDRFTFGSRVATVIETPGHTRAHIVYWFADDGVAFVGDTLFVMGCGRLFEGTAAQMWTSLQKLMGLPDDTRIYCAHEYTQSNGRFALTVEPGNADLVARMKEVDRLRATGQPTVPSTIGQEKRTNPFLRPASLGLRATLGMADATDVDVFAEVRRRKDRF